MSLIDTMYVNDSMSLEDFLQEWNNSSDVVLVHTSGSTGKPKPMWAEKKRMLNSARITNDFLGLKEGDTALLCMPLDYIAGKMMVVRSIERKMQLIAEEPSGHPLSVNTSSPSGRLGGVSGGVSGGISLAAMVPLQVYNSLQVPEEREKLRSIQHLLIGGGAVDEDMAQELKNFPNSVWSTYAMTETLSNIALRRLNGPEASEWYTPFDSVGISLNAEGCIVIDAPLVHDGILTTNDRAELRTLPNGKVQFRILGRKDNVIDSGGIKIQIEEVEKTLKPFLSAPYLITKAKDKKFGETVVLLTEQNDLAEVSEICMNALPKYWQPHRYIHVDNIPLTETGKPARAKAMQIAAE